MDAEYIQHGQARSVSGETGGNYGQAQSVSGEAGGNYGQAQSVGGEAGETAAQIKGAIFDMDGLIFDSERVVQRTWFEIGELWNIPDLGEQIYHTIGFNRRRRETYFKSVYGEDFPHDQMVEETRKRFERIEREEGLPVKEGVRELMEFLRSKGCAIGLATSASADYAADQLKNAGLYDFFDGFVYGNMVNHSKPDPEIYIKACKAVGIHPEEGIALEDAPSGVQSAWSAGLRVIMIPDLVQPTAEIREKAWYVRNSLLQVPELVEKYF